MRQPVRTVRVQTAALAVRQGLMTVAQAALVLKVSVAEVRLELGVDRDLRRVT